ncbi:Cytochrome P450 oxidoreductase [Venustampulla echinocandica]|uniref:Cytochrome P450 oxidoreductase n=1 Tax=Venustampulla echinocandica TaxID=2656787 RepID=A0A370TKZ4_9HELO|nr:Cytochrome P450 oxidoreductase [Venustampulla echinocandica]RDL36198.1 Cytochrome P450 oxidoreductase [Venustampulla echinocandica]
MILDQIKSSLATVVAAGAEFVALYPLPLLAIVILSILTLNVISVLKTRYFHLNTIPGPSFAAFTRLWLCKVIASGDSAKKFVDINKEFGPIARIGPNHLLTDDPEVVRRILAARSHYTRGPWFDSIRIDPHVPNIVSERDTGKHNHLRHRMSAGYSGKEILGTEAIIDERISDFVERIEQKWVSENGETKVFDIGRRIQYLAVDIITHLCFGEPLGFVDQDRDVHDFLFTIESQLPIVQHFSVIIEINTMVRNIMSFSWIKKALAPSARDKTGIGKIMGISKKVVDQRILPLAEPKKDMLGSFLKHGLTADEAEAEISISLVAGSDTTATSMRATLLAIITNPSVYAKLQAEIDAADRAGLLSSPIKESEASKLPYLQACISEGLRRFPPITQLRERQVPPEGDIINGHHVPGGTFIGLNAWGLQLNSVFGWDPEIFRPERWLIEDKDLLLRMQKVHELIFGYGNTKCLGIPIAMLNLNKIFVEVSIPITILS